MFPQPLPVLGDDYRFSILNLWHATALVDADYLKVFAVTPDAENRVVVAPAAF